MDTFKLTLYILMFIVLASIFFALVRVFTAYYLSDFYESLYRKVSSFLKRVFQKS